jgi:hypothetical protein
VWGRGEVNTGFYWGNLSEEGHWEDPGKNERMILKFIFEKRGGGMDWIDLVHDRERWWALVNAVMNLQVP